MRNLTRKTIESVENDIRNVEASLIAASQYLGDANEQRDRESAAFWFDEVTRLSLLLKEARGLLKVIVEYKKYA